MATIQITKTPRPVPVFYTANTVSFSTKKERQTPYNRRSMRTLAKSAPPVSRIFPHRWWSQKPKSISFKHHQQRDTYLTEDHYNESVKQSYFEQCFTVECKIGEGSFGEVFKVRSKENGRVYAVKKSIEPFRSSSDRLEKLSEVQKHEQLPRHANLIQFIKAWEECGCLYIQTELCKTSLSSLSEYYHELPQFVIWNYLIDLLLAVKHLHDHDLIHMDIKPDNIFISEDGICKLGDFGLVTDLKKRTYDDIKEGDSKYLAPEVLESKIGKHVDIFSLGLTILEIACDLDLPSSGDSWQMLRHGVLPEHLMMHLSPELHHMITIMMEPNYLERPSASELLCNPKISHLVKRRQLYCSYRKLVNTLKEIVLLFWLYTVFYLKFAYLKPFYINYVTSKLRKNQPVHNHPSSMSPVHASLPRKNLLKDFDDKSSSSDEEL